MNGAIGDQATIEAAQSDVAVCTSRALVILARTAAAAHAQACPTDPHIDAVLASAFALAIRELTAEHEHLPALVAGLIDQST